MNIVRVGSSALVLLHIGVFPDCVSMGIAKIAVVWESLVTISDGPGRSLSRSNMDFRNVSAGCKPPSGCPSPIQSTLLRTSEMCTSTFLVAWRNRFCPQALRRGASVTVRLVTRPYVHLQKARKTEPANDVRVLCGVDFPADHSTKGAGVPRCRLALNPKRTDPSLKWAILAVVA